MSKTELEQLLDNIVGDAWRMARVNHQYGYTIGRPSLSESELDLEESKLKLVEANFLASVAVLRAEINKDASHETV